ncbi:hypothetical protein Pcac1_g11683 [Phytophthora cactorum]|uniref:Uncharacterized protein n=1 Tax=Phytophthora cactorum TaxID=29920 RepID=A0A8T1GC18_9STRA|nr:hypothetical protein Pcac1_g11683 [Phytophthora cactorum]KAG2985603.1 hypothetical protein PC118_g8237 [Phytophthora cactorum]
MAMVDGELHPSLKCDIATGKLMYEPVTVSEPKNVVEAARARSKQQMVAVNGRGRATTGCSGDEQCEERPKDGKASGADAERAVLTSDSATRVTS